MAPRADLQDRMNICVGHILISRGNILIALTLSRISHTKPQLWPFEFKNP